MFKNKRKAAMLPLILFIVVCVLVLAIVSSRPYDRPSRYLTNSFGNTMNGACVAADGSLFYYIDSNGVLRCQGEKDIYRIAGDAKCAFPYANGIIYISKDELRFSHFSGGEPTVLQKKVDFVQVSGNWVYYTRDNLLYKMRIFDHEEHCLDLKVQQYAVAGTYTYYLSEDGYLYYARNDGSDSVKFLDQKMKQFQLFDNYVFYIDSKGNLCKSSAGNAAFSSTLIESVEQFVVNNEGIVFYYDGQKLFYRDLTNEEAESHETEADYTSVSHIQYVGDSFYFYDNGELIKMKMDGSEKTKL